MSKNQILFEKLKEAHNRGRLGHALLFVSPDPNHENFLDELYRFSAFLLCPEAGPQDLKSCGRCESCLAFRAPRDQILHPDFHALQPDSAHSYSVEQMRPLQNSLGLGRALAKAKLALLFSAEDLSSGASPAANALLKLLEEPRPHTYLILVTHRPDGLLKTIRSRCQSYRFSSESDAAETQSQDHERLEAWRPLLEWLQRGAPSQQQKFRVPADQDSYWKSKEEAYAELEEVHAFLWKNIASAWATLPHEASTRVLDFFLDYEDFLRRLRGHGQGSLQWLKLRARVK